MVELIKTTNVVRLTYIQALIDDADIPTQGEKPPLKATKHKESDSISLASLPVNPGELLQWETTVLKKVVAAAADVDGATVWFLR